jgi:hypothetical protein
MVRLVAALLFNPSCRGARLQLWAGIVRTVVRHGGTVTR